MGSKSSCVQWKGLQLHVYCGDFLCTNDLCWVKAKVPPVDLCL